MTLMMPTDIMLGRGPTCYNNAGNKAFRKLVKEHAVFYTNNTRRKEKAALVKLLISKLEAKGYRFLHHPSTAGTWVEAPRHLVEKKVGHGLRDARLLASKIGGDNNVLPKNSSPDTTEQAHQREVEPAITVKEESNEGEQGEELYNAAIFTTGKDSDGHLMQGGVIQETGLQVLDAKAPINLSKPFDSTSVPHAFLVADESWEDTELQSFDNEIDECSNQLGSGCHVNNTAEQWSHEFPSASEVERGLEYRGASWVDKNDAIVIPVSVPSHEVQRNATLDAALTMYAAFYKDLLSFEDCSAGDRYEPLKYDDEDAHTQCRRFRHLL